VGPWLPEPILTAETSEAADPEKRVETEESISLAFLVLLEQLQPFERAVFLLREDFAYEFAEMATMLDKSEAACRSMKPTWRGSRQVTPCLKAGACP
jgi:RNA polymerase sigma-70 factor, ECF subfamily